MQKIVAAIFAVLVAGCASSGVVPTGPNSYLISKQSAAGMFGTPAGVLADIHREANAFCAQRNEVAETITAETKGAIPFARQGSASLNFRCVKAAS